LGFKYPRESYNGEMKKSMIGSEYFTLEKPLEALASPYTCGNLNAIHWSDIQQHYYCNIPIAFRACHRLLISWADDPKTAQWKDTAHEPPGIDFARAETRTRVTKACLAKGATLSTKQLTHPTVVWAMDFAAEFKAFYETQWVKTKGGERVNMFDYIMNAQTYAFAYRSQQAVINTFYGEMKPVGQGVWDPSKKSECKAWRPLRLVDDRSELGNHCDPKTPKTAFLHGIGR
jgi:hypothetical protein